MVTIILVNIVKESLMEKEDINGVKVAIIRGHLLEGLEKELENGFRVQVIFMKESFIEILSKERVKKYIKMVKYLSDSLNREFNIKESFMMLMEK